MSGLDYSHVAGCFALCCCIKSVMELYLLSQILKKKRFLHLGAKITPENILANNSVKEISVQGENLIYATGPSKHFNTIRYASFLCLILFYNPETHF